MSANQAQAQAQVAAQAAQPSVDNNQQAQSTEIKDITMSEANAENAQGEGEQLTPTAGLLPTTCSERYHPSRRSV